MGPLLGFIDGAQVTAGVLHVAGWAHSPDSDVDLVTVGLDGRCLGRARTGVSRPDVAAELGTAEAAYAGFEFELIERGNSIEDLRRVSVTVTLTDGSSADLPAVAVTSPASSVWATGRVFGAVDAPMLRAAVVDRDLFLEGWVYSDIGMVSRLEVWASGRPLGRALVRLRPDVAEALGDPDALLAGFELQTQLPEDLGDRTALQLVAVLPDGDVAVSHAWDVTIEQVHRRQEVREPVRGGTRVSSAKTGRTRILWYARGLNRGGCQLRMGELIRHFSSLAGVESTVLSPVDGPLRHELEAAGANVIVSVQPSLLDAHGYESAVGELGSWLNGRFDLVIAATVTGFPAIEGALGVGIPCVLRLGEAAPLRRVVRWLFGKIDPEIEAHAREAIAGASLVISNSRAAIDTYLSDGFTARFVLVPTGVDVSRARSVDGARRTATRRSMGIQDDEVVFMCAGGIWPVKGQALLVEAMGRLRDSHPELRCLLVGDAETRYVKAIAELVQRRGLEGRVHLLPFQSDLGGLWAASDVGVCASESEALPAAVLEAMSYRLPVLASRVGDLPDVIEPGRNGWLCDCSAVESLVEGLVAVAGTAREDLQEMGRSAFRTVAESFDQRVMLDRWEELVHAVANGRFADELAV